MKFAKLFDLDNDEQVLLTCDYNDGDDKYELSIRTDFEAGVGQIKLGFAEEEKALETMEKYEMTDAVKYRKSMSAYFE